MRFLLSAFLCGFFSLGAVAQSGWNFSVEQQFVLEDTAYFKRFNIRSMTVTGIDSSGEETVFAFAEFDTDYKLMHLYGEQTHHYFQYDSLAQLVEKLVFYGQPFAVDSTYLHYDSLRYRHPTHPRQGDTVRVSRFVLKNGRQVNKENALTNDRFHREKFIHPSTGEKIKPLKKKLETRCRIEDVFVVKQERIKLDKHLEEYEKPQLICAIRAETFDPPVNPYAEKPSPLAQNPNESHYHRKVSFNAKGLIDKFHFQNRNDYRYRVGYTFFP